MERMASVIALFYQYWLSFIAVIMTGLQASRDFLEAAWLAGE